MKACAAFRILASATPIMENTHYEQPHAPSREELQAIDAVAERTSFWLNAELL
jgi:hypothetical protein